MVGIKKKYVLVYWINKKLKSWGGRGIINVI